MANILAMKVSIVQNQRNHQYTLRRTLCYATHDMNGLSISVFLRVCHDSSKAQTEELQRKDMCSIHQLHMVHTGHAEWE